MSGAAAKGKGDRCEDVVEVAAVGCDPLGDAMASTLTLALCASGTKCSSVIEKVFSDTT